MTTVSFALDPGELATDRVALSSINFCALWPTAKPILQQLAGVISSSMVKFAINTVISAGDAYCKQGSNRLETFGIALPAGSPAEVHAALSNLSDQELSSLAAIQKKLNITPVQYDVGTYVF